MKGPSILSPFIISATLLFSGAGLPCQPETANPAKETKMILGLRTVMYHVADINKAKDWYTQVLGYKPYFDEPFYVGFNVNGYELGLHPADAKVMKDGGTFAYWGVKDCKAAHQRLLELGATPNTDVQDVGGGILVATVIDPWGNIFGVIENPHFKLEEK
jgi:predicted enzyme related to lactoylglutathione lyase